LISRLAKLAGPFLPFKDSVRDSTAAVLHDKRDDAEHGEPCRGSAALLGVEGAISGDSARAFRGRESSPDDVRLSEREPCCDEAWKLTEAPQSHVTRAMSAKHCPTLDRRSVQCGPISVPHDNVPVFDSAAGPSLDRDSEGHESRDEGDNENYVRTAESCGEDGSVVDEAAFMDLVHKWAIEHFAGGYFLENELVGFFADEARAAADCWTDMGVFKRVSGPRGPGFLVPSERADGSWEYDDVEFAEFSMGRDTGDNG